ncbi:hypothetical protein FIBSPDRAFT_938558 [Athelia psychrophila]|uniref:Uncharacterized protein n=1 Tax=Athelia psychrophila TaxID=1759441 RepID=A0A165Y6G7_9AGAM|nr:hypothetical protein FIBSPDRAFT_938558 [Fibularhizoctonia sp. CBS 109695]
MDNYHSKMGQADTRHQLLQERFDEQPLTLRITKEANGDLDVSLSDLDEQLKGCRDLAQSNTHPVDMAVIPQRNTTLKLIADKCQTDLVMTQQTNTNLNGRLVDMTSTQEKNAFSKALQTMLNWSLKVKSQRHRDSKNHAKVDLRRSSKDLRRIEDDVRAQLSLQDPGMSLPLAVHEKATNHLKQQDRMIANLTRQATILAARYGDRKLASHHLFIHFV